MQLAAYAPLGVLCCCCISGGEISETAVDGEISYQELLQFLQIKESTYIRRVLRQLLRRMRLGDMTFEEFVTLVITICLQTKAEILRTTFDAFDTDQSGTLQEVRCISLAAAKAGCNHLRARCTRTQVASEHV